MKLNTLKAAGEKSEDGMLVCLDTIGPLEVSGKQCAGFSQISFILVLLRVGIVK